jgi:hypothetical protein
MRTLLVALRLEPGRAIFGPTQTASDNLIAIVINGLVALYFWNTLRGEWTRLEGNANFSDVRRLYRYLWVIYGLLMTIFGAQQVLRFIFYVPTGLLGELGRETAVNGLALLLIGTPVWLYAWMSVQRSLPQPEENESNLRLGILYILALSGVITVLTTAAITIQILVARLLGNQLAVSTFVDRIGGPISIGIPLGAVWAYYGHWLNRHIESAADPVRQAAMKRVYLYVLSALGLGGGFVGIALLIKFIIDRLTGSYLFMDDAVRSSLATAISVILAWLPLWLIAWRRLQADVAPEGDAGDHARRSVIRRGYLYLALFAGVIGGMISAVALVFQLIRTALTGQSEGTFLSTVLNDLQLLVLFAILLLYHLLVMRRDGRWTAAALARKHAAFRVVVVDSGGGFGDSVRAALGKVAPNVPVTVTTSRPRGKFDVMVLSGNQLLEAPAWVRLFSGTRVVVPEESHELLWAGGLPAASIQKAALTVRQLAEGQAVRQRAASSGWMVVVYVAAALFGMELILMLVGLVVSSFVR